MSMSISIYKLLSFTDEISRLKFKAALFVVTSSCLSACTYVNLEDAEAGRIDTPDSLAVVGPLQSESTNDVTEQVAASQEQKLQDQTEASPVTVPSSVTAPIEKNIDTRGQVTTRPPVKEVPKTLVTKQATTKASIYSANLDSVRKTDKPVSLSKLQKVSKKAVARLQAGKTSQINKVGKPIGGSLEGSVVIVGNNNKLLPSKGVILTLTPSDGRVLSLDQRAPMTHTIDMQDKTYLPGYISIRKNDRVSFVNKDKIKHNVFSSTGKNAFDLGTYSAGKKREVTLNSAGIVKVYCNIHADMATFISVSDNSISVVADHQGHFSIKDLEPGEYNLNVWHVRGEKTEKIVIKSQQKNKYITSLNTANYKKVAHKNKFGKKYNKNSAIFDDEFY